MGIGEVGTVSTNSPVENAPIRVDFTEPLTDPVIALTSTNFGGHAFVLRVVEVDSNGFSFIIEEWEYLDGPHPVTETINWLAVEEGVHTLPDGRVIEAGFATTSGNSTNVGLSGGFESTPVVLTSVMSNNDTTTVDSDPLNISTTGFTLNLQEEQALANDHGSETIGFIAIEPGGTAESGTAGVPGSVGDVAGTLSIGDTFDNPIVLVETQSLNDTDPGGLILTGGDNDSVTVSFKEEQSSDGETAHAQEQVGIVAFEEGIIVPCFTPGALIDTPLGPRLVETLCEGDLVLTADSGPQPILWCSQTRLDTPTLGQMPQHWPILIKAHAFGPGSPTCDMRVSPQHRILVSGWRAEILFSNAEVLVPAKALVNGHSVRVETPTAPLNYLHLMLPAHHVLKADGLAVESLHPEQVDRAALTQATRSRFLASFPDLAAMPNSYGSTARPIARCREARLLMAA